MDAETFRVQGHHLIDWIARFFEHIEAYPVLARVAPGDITRGLPERAPSEGERFEDIFDDFEKLLLPGITHWNHPGFFAYFPTSGSGPGVLAELLAAALNAQAMLWRTGPAATELEEVALSWLRELMGLPSSFEGVIYDTASISSLHALAAARQLAVPQVKERGLAARPDIAGLTVYCSEEAHSSIDKAVMLIGLGRESIRRIATDDRFRMRPDALGEAIAIDRRKGLTPMAVVATVGTTSTTSIDPVDRIAEICAREGVWLHVDAAYGGVAAILPEMRDILKGVERADSLVVNPHKWLFTPFDLSAMYCRRMNVVRDTFSLAPVYLQTGEAPVVKNLMDTGIQLGRRFRSLKLWAILRFFGADGLRSRLAEHIRLARLFAAWVDESRRFERVAPVPFSVVCFRATLPGLSDANLDALNQKLLDEVNATGEIFISHTQVRERFVLRLAVGNIRTAERHVARAWALLNETLDRLPATS
ncbi:MAG: amino acid decarboxylase [Acidobacteria bacterium]|nr:amino acid decarboxylase [Acidobacteriota bacterium]